MPEKKVEILREFRRYPRYGWKAMIGIIHLPGGVNGIADFHKVAPAGVNMVLNYVPLHENESAEELDKLCDHVVEVAASRPFVLFRPDVMLWLCTAGSFMKGIGFDQELIKGMEKVTNVPATTTSTAMIDAFKEMGLKKICVVTPYPPDANKIEKKFIEDNGVGVLKCVGFEFVDLLDIMTLHPQKVYEFVKEIDVPESDGIFISCTGLDVLEIIEPLEQELGKPVLTSNQVSFWKAFKLAKVMEPIPGYGKLLNKPR